MVATYVPVHPSDTAGKESLSPLPTVLRNGLIAVAALGFLSFLASVTLFFLLVWRLIAWSRKKQAYNQFVLLILNLVLADIQQSLAFLLNVQWLIRDEINVGSSTCWAQAWFVSTGDLASGIWCLAIGVHTFASVILNYRVSNRTFFAIVIGLWAFVYSLAIVCVVLHPNDIFVRAGAWCWINKSYEQLRLWTHYFFIFTAEFGVIFIYSLMYFILSSRISTRYVRSPQATERARQAAKLMVVYPLVYVICTLPLASFRMASMAGRSPSFVQLCIAGAMITSNGWIDVLLYTLTRRVMLFSDVPPDDDAGIGTFQVPFWGGAQRRFGTTTTIEALNTQSLRRSRSYGRSIRSDIRKDGRLPSSGASRQSSLEELFAATQMADGVVKTHTTVEVHSEPIEMDDIRELKEMADRARPPSANADSVSLESKSIKFDLERDFPSHFDR